MRYPKPLEENKMNKSDIYQQVADKIINMMETMGTNWVKPWADLNQPINLVSGKPYRGLNVLFLNMSGYSDATWATYKQWLSKGYQVQRKEDVGGGTGITFYKPIKIKDKVSGKDKMIPFLKPYTVFNAAQVADENGKSYTTQRAAPLSENERSEKADAFIENTGASINHGGDVACYVPSIDQINMPKYAAFKNAAAYYGTMFHELAHWTGAKQRLNRLDSGTYAWEELVAELSAAMTCAALGIESVPREDHAKYLNAWIARIKDDPRALVRAITKAKQASEYLETLQEESDDAMLIAA